jgi:hypothetical protein
MAVRMLTHDIATMPLRVMTGVLEPDAGYLP